MDELQKILDEYDAQIVYWRPVEDADDYTDFMYQNRLTYFEEVLVKTLFEDGSGSVQVSFLEPESDGHGGFLAKWHMTAYARKFNMKMTHWMPKPKPPVGTTLS